MARINRRSRSIVAQPRRPRAHVIELLIGPDGASLFASETERQALWATIQPELTPEFAAQWHVASQGDQSSLKPFVSIAEQYARSVVSGEIPAGRYVRLACQRHLDDLQRSLTDPNFPYEFDAAKATRPCRFIELLPHTKGKWASRGERIVLEPWQAFIVTTLFGWVHRQSRARRFTLFYGEIPRKNAKSTLAAGIGNYCFACDNEFGAEVYSGATKEDQAMEVFRPALQMMERSAELARVLGITVKAKRMFVSADGSRFNPVVRDPGDGASPSLGIVDEYHEHDDDTLFDTFRTGMGAREQALLFVITTGGTNLAGPCYALHSDIVKMLEGALADERTFAIIYCLDEGDDWTTEASLRKVNPNYGVSVSPEFLLSEMHAALLKPRKRSVFRTKHQNAWDSALSALFDVFTWKKLGDPSLKRETFIGSPCWMSLDYSSRKDFCSRGLLFERVHSGRKHYFYFVDLYLPQAQIDAPESQQYREWFTNGHIIPTEGDTVDLVRVCRETIAEVQRFKPRELAFDPWNAEQTAQEVAAKTPVTPLPIQQSTRMLSAPTKEVDVLITEGRVHHDGNPVMAWMIGNVAGKEDANENVFPRKEEGQEQNKIDGAMTLIMTVSRAMTSTAPARSVYATRGLRTL